jgi:hypothetical protein
VVAFIVTAEIYRRFQGDLDAGAESAGFFLAAYDPAARDFRLREWRPIASDGFESRSAFHLVLRDETRAEIIKWAWDSGASLVEAHSHDFGVAAFSPSDIHGLGQWVPHLWWRLGGRPYGAILVDGETLDALAWIEDADKPEQVVGLTIDGDRSVAATGQTLAHSGSRRGEGYGR